MKLSAFAGKLHQTIIVCASCALAALAGPAQATNYYIATYGSDSNSGLSTNANQAWATLTYAVSKVSAGDTVYMRGGTYPVSAQINMAVAGSSGSRYTVTNYPGETPTLNCSSETSGEGIRITGSYWQLYGLVITNAYHNGINIRANGTLTGSFNRIERCVVTGCRNSGMLIGSSSISGSFLPGTNFVVNCDAIRNFDGPSVGGDGGNADGFSVKWNVGAGNEFHGCRSWENSDDGWDLWMSTNAVLIADCWTFRNGSNVWGASNFKGNGNGFKLGGNYIAANHTLVRGLAYQNVNNGSGGNGVDQNNNTGNLTVDHVTSWANSGAANFALSHNSGHGNQSHLVRNNVSMAPGTAADAFTSNTTQLSNSWNNGGITVVSNDFVSMDASQLIGPRQADGSLPVITLVHPVPCGRLVDKGIIISGYSYNGCAPDLGAYETTDACPPVAAFSGTPTNGAAPLAVTFTDNSTLCVSNRYWSFGDGATSNTTATTVSHTYGAGAYTVALTVSGIGGSNTLTRSNYIVTANLPVASFSASPTNGLAPLPVTFTDTSSGAINNLFWDLGDSTTTNTAGGASFPHTYAAGTYTVTLIASNSDGTSMAVSNNLITAFTTFQAWQLQYFGCTDCPQAQPDADPLGKGLSNADQFLAGLNPTNPASVFRITSAVPQGNDVVITWATAGGKTNAVQATGGDANGGFTTNFVDITTPPHIIVSGSGDVTTNYTDEGGATNTPAHYYRIRLVP